MSSGRASVFGQDADLDLSDFKPKTPVEPKQVRNVAEQAGFRSREALEPSPPEEAAQRQPHRYRTGRNVQLNLKVRRETVDAFYKVADEQRWVLGEAFEHAVKALEEKLKRDTK